MAYWLFKEEPDHYSYADLERDGETAWDGVSNNLALKHLREVKKGDRIFFYHTGKEKAIVGEMRAVADATTDSAGNVSVQVAPVRRLPRPVTLAEIKRDAHFKDWQLVRMFRLSVMPATAEQWRRAEALAKQG